MMRHDVQISKSPINAHDNSMLITCLLDPGDAAWLPTDSRIELGVQFSAIRKERKKEHDELIDEN